MAVIQFTLDGHSKNRRKIEVFLDDILTYPKKEKFVIRWESSLKSCSYVEMTLRMIFIYIIRNFSVWFLKNYSYDKQP